MKYVRKHKTAVFWNAVWFCNKLMGVLRVTTVGTMTAATIGPTVSLDRGSVKVRSMA